MKNKNHKRPIRGRTQFAQGAWMMMQSYMDQARWLRSRGIDSPVHKYQNVRYIVRLARQECGYSRKADRRK